MIKYYGVYSNKSRGLRKKEEEKQKPKGNDISEIDSEINKLIFSNMKRKKFNKKMGKAHSESIQCRSPQMPTLLR
jgi:hypothetical protein